MTVKRFTVLYKLEMSLSEKDELVSMKPQPIFKRLKGESETKSLGARIQEQLKHKDDKRENQRVNRTRTNREILIKHGVIKF